MGQKGFEFPEFRIDIEELRELAKKTLILEGWPLPVLLALYSERPGDWREIHPSELGRCLRQRVLSWGLDFYSRPDRSWAPFLGRGVHELAAKAAQSLFPEGEALIEVRLSWPLELEGERLVLSGQIDLYHRPSRTLLDYKTTGSLNPKRPLPWEYELQQNLYAQLLRWHGESPEKIWLWFVETKTRKPKSGPFRVAQTLLSVPLWPEEAVLGVLEEIGRVLVLGHRDGILPPPFREEDEGYWQCRFCPVSERCRELEREGR